MNVGTGQKTVACACTERAKRVEVRAKRLELLTFPV